MSEQDWTYDIHGQEISKQRVPVYEPAAQPAPGRVIGVDAYEKLLDKALALEAERDQLQQLVELKEGNTRAQQARADDYLERMGMLRAEHDALREALLGLGTPLINGDGYCWCTYPGISIKHQDYCQAARAALDAAQKAHGV